MDNKGFIKETAAKAGCLSCEKRKLCKGDHKTMSQIVRESVTSEDLRAMREALERRASKGDKEAARLHKQYFESVAEAPSGSAASPLAEADRALLERVAYRLREKKEI